ncbi:bacteriocin immunity protein [Pseudomonas sp. 148P]|uniref:Bacteriocin immunity protein n=1 Tax=Pseudomonas ulcerans TaxID=3115852 RepID=A0ABU7HK42_9PSED|nr:MULTISPECIES: bacteriocin immunity protein [unclassified Pseudomonas]MEE1922216.1 bacteriocin immunity protein [Pseudomonas sp. 147P]MEE1931861.1 bacteriocin immunity protein [Pseudomonas sp. 148P]
MEFKAQLSDYTRDEFKALVSAIWHGETDNDTRTLLINHFDSIVGHPLGSDLIFYPPDSDTASVHSIDNVVFHVQNWHNSKGLAAFRNEPAPQAPPGPSLRLSQQERKVLASQQDLAKARQLVADVDAAVQAVDQAMLHLGRLLDEWQAQTLDSRTIAGHIEEMTRLERTQSDMVRAINKLEFMKQKVQFAKSGAERDVTSPFRDPGIQSDVLAIVTAASNRYLEALADVERRHRQLHDRCMPLFEEAEAHLAHRLSAPGAQTQQAPHVVQITSWPAQLRPCLMFATDSAAIGRRELDAMKQSIRSAIAEFAWQATSLNAEHPGTFSGVAGFFYDHWKSHDGYVVSVPLGDFMPIDGHDWQQLARSGAQVDLPYRLFPRSAPVTPGKIAVGLKAITELQQVCLTPTSGDSLSSKVPVVMVAREPSSATFSLAVSGQTPMVIHWHRSVGIQDLSPEAPATYPMGGLVRTPETPLMESLETNGPVVFDDCVLVFPTDSGLDPLYLMFKRSGGIPL